MGDLVTADEALGLIAAGSIGWVYSPRTAGWFRIDGTGPGWAPGASQPADVFELVGFGGSSVVRWTRSPGLRTGQLRTDDVPAPGDPGRTALASLLAGSVVGVADGWARLRASNGAAFWAPVADAHVGNRIVLDQVEVVAVDTHGNARVVDTLPIGLRILDGEEVA